MRCIVGYAGGEASDPTYQSIQDHTEAILIEYDPSILSFEDVLNLWSEEDYPYVPQKCQYRSAIFPVNSVQVEQAQAYVERLTEQRGRKLYVDVELIQHFYRGEEYHQDFLKKQKSSRTLRMF